MHIYPAATSVTPSGIRQGADSNIYIEFLPHGFMVMTVAEASLLANDLSRLVICTELRQKSERAAASVKPCCTELRRKSDQAARGTPPPALFPIRSIPETRTDFDKDDDASGV